jgi:integrase
MVKSPFEVMDVDYDPHDSQLTRTNTSAENALNEKEFEQLYDGVRQLEPLYDLVMEFFVLATGRLGLRIGELMHIKPEWIDFEEKWIHVPAHEKCERGRDGGICGTCRSLAKQTAERNDITQSEAEKLYWKSKSPRSEREIPYSFSDRCERVIERYFEEFDKMQGSRQTLIRRLNTALEMSELDVDRVQPHALRATAATYHAGTGMDVWTLQAFMGWAYAETAEHYILNSAQRTKKVLEEFHSE